LTEALAPTDFGTFLTGTSLATGFPARANVIFARRSTRRNSSSHWAFRLTDIHLHIAFTITQLADESCPLRRA